MAGIRLGRRYQLAAVRRSRLIRTVVLFKPEHDSGEVSKLAVFVRDMTTVEKRAAAYVCEGFSCMAPVTTADELQEVLKSAP